MRKIIKAKSTLGNVEKMEAMGFTWGSKTVNTRTGYTVECWYKDDCYCIARK